MSKINSYLCMKIIDRIGDMLVIDVNTGNANTLSRAEVKDIVEEMSGTRTVGKITLNFNEHGQIVNPELTLKGDAVIKLFSNLKNKED